MSPELDRRLCEKYPMLYAQRGMDMRSTCMCWGFECSDGWHGLIDRLSAKLEEINRRLPPGDGEKNKVEACQVKEKFGTLRFYVDTASDVDDEACRLISEAEAESARTCEECGAPGKSMAKNFWYKTLCDKCRAGLGYEEVKDE